MSTSYKYKKCNIFGFSQSLDILNDKFNNIITIDNEPMNLSDDFIEENKQLKLNMMNSNDDKYNDDIPTFAINLEGEWFNDINILTDENKNNNYSSDSKQNFKNNNDKKTTYNNSSTNNYKHDDNELSKIITGQSTQLEAFTKNVYTVIYGKKTANIPQGNNNAHIFNHNVIDSLARNGVISDQVSDNVLSVHKLFKQLEKLYIFNIIFIHSALELEYIQHESPTDISHPVYIKGRGEICAVVYRLLLLKFFPYLTIVSESMRENAYLF